MYGKTVSMFRCLRASHNNNKQHVFCCNELLHRQLNAIGRCMARFILKLGHVCPIKWRTSWSSRINPCIRVRRAACPRAPRTHDPSKTRDPKTEQNGRGLKNGKNGLFLVLVARRKTVKTYFPSRPLPPTPRAAPRLRLLRETARFRDSRRATMIDNE